MHRRGNWAGPKWTNLRERDDDTISNYSNPDYVIGNPTSAALDTVAAGFEQLSVELEAPSRRSELDTVDPTLRYEISNSPQIREEPLRVWPDHLTQPAELDGRDLWDRDD